MIIGDANLAETSTYLKLGATALVLDMIEAGLRFDDVKLADPVQAVHLISHDPTLKQTVELADGRKFTGLDLQRVYHERAARFLDEHGGGERAARDVLETWGEVLDLLGSDPMSCADRLDWPAKLRLLESYRSRDNLGWASPRLHMIDLQYSDVRMDKGLYNRLVARGSMKRLVSEDEVRDAMITPPEDTRAYFRAAAWSATRRRSPRRPGTRSSSTWAGSRWCASRRWNRCAAPRRTSAHSWRRRPAPRSWSIR